MHVGGTVHVAGCPADVSHGAVPRNRGRGDRHGRFGMVPGQVRGVLRRQRLEPMTHLGGTSELMTQIGWDRTITLVVGTALGILLANWITAFEGSNSKRSCGLVGD